MVKEGQKVTVKVLEKKNDKLKLSIKALQKTPWDLFAEENKVGDTVTGKIVRKMANGMLIEVAKDVVGMISSREYSWDPRQNLAGTVGVGAMLELQIVSFDPEARKMGLSKKHLEYNPWKDVTVKVDEEVSGVVEELQTRGALVKIQNVQAFLPIGEITTERVQQVSEVLKVEDIANGNVTI